MAATWTVTGSGAVVLSPKKSKYPVRLTSATMGRGPNSRSRCLRRPSPAGRHQIFPYRSPYNSAQYQTPFPFAEWAGAGATVPLSGFGNMLFQGVKKAVDTDGFLGLFKGGLSETAVGISGALVMGYLAALVFRSKMKM